MSILRVHGRPVLAGMLAASVLLWGAAEVPAVALCGSGKGEESVQAPASRAGQLPSLAGIAEAAMPAVVNISTTQKVKWRRRRPPLHTPGPSPFGEGDPFEEFFRRF